MYGTVNAGDVYFAALLQGANWKNATETSKLQALNSATLLIDGLNISWETTDDPYPTAVGEAAYEIAECLLNGFDPDMELRSMTQQSESFGSISANRVANAVPDHLAAGIPSIVAWRKLRPYLTSTKYGKLYRS